MDRFDRGNDVEGMKHVKHGYWVRYDDVEDLEVENARLKKVVRAQNKEIKRLKFEIEVA